MRTDCIPSDGGDNSQTGAIHRPQGASILSLTEVAKQRGPRWVLDEVTFDAYPGECIVVCGPSGSGKTTLLRVIAGLDKIQRGEVRIGGRPHNSAAGAKGRQGTVGMVFQGEQLYSNLTLLNNVMLGPVRVLKQSRHEAGQRARELLDAVGLHDKASRFPHELSGGERQRGAIARALAMSPQLMIFDEPTSALDPSCVKEVLALIFALHERGQTMILATHETGFARMIADRIICMDAGKIREVGAPHKMIVAPEHSVTRRLFGDALVGISALDRVVYTHMLHVGYFHDSERDALPHAPFIRQFAQSFDCQVSLRKINPSDPLLQMRMGMADLIVSATAIDDEHNRLHAMPVDWHGKPYTAYLSGLDTAWVRAVRHSASRRHIDAQDIAAHAR